MFIISFMIHALGGTATYNQEAKYHNNSTITPTAYVTTSQSWYESLQDWQSEFLAVGSILLLSIKLRERGSAESKPAGKRRDKKTGS